MKNLIILGATGVIGSSVLDIIRQYPQQFSLLGFTAWSNIEKAVVLIKEFSPSYVVLKEKHDTLPLLFPNITFLYGEEGLSEICRVEDCDTVVSAVLGINGLLPAIEVLKQGKTLITANKETLVTGGKILKQYEQQYKGVIIPLNRNLFALFDLLRGKEGNDEIRELMLMDSGGSFLHRKMDNTISKKEVLQNPILQMGHSTTIRSSLMLNKGLEIIEAMRLFELPEHQIRVVIHPQDLVHAAIHTKRGYWNFLASPTDMRYPALHTLFYPNIFSEAPFDTYDPTLKALEFHNPDYHQFPLLALARQVAREDGLLPTVLCAVTEVAIEQFLIGNIAFYKIPDLIHEILHEYPNQNKPELEEILIADKKTKIMTLKRILYQGEDLR